MRQYNHDTRDTRHTLAYENSDVVGSLYFTFK